MSALVSAQHLVKRFDDFTAVDGISLTVNKGEVLGFLGPNGAGKTTTMRMITGYLTPTGGQVTIDGIAMQDSPEEAKARIGYLPEGAPLYPDMTPRQFLQFIGRVRAMDASTLSARMDDVVEQLHLSAVLDQSIETLSKGFKRRVGLAQAILHDPDVLILDEPTDGLDPNQKFEVRNLIHAMASDKAIIISTHILEEVDAVCTRAVIIAQGKLLADGTPDELRRKVPGEQNLDGVFRVLTTAKAEEKSDA